MNPKKLSQFIGNEEAKEKLLLKIHAALKQEKRIPHLGLFGPSGIGKSTLAQLLMKEIGGGYVYINSTAIKDPIVFRSQISEAASLAKTLGRSLIMLDECHMLPRKIQDNLLSLLEEPSILCTTGFRYDEDKKMAVKDKNGILKEKLPHNISFCLATTHPGNLTDPLLNRLFKVDLEQYSINELVAIAQKNIINLPTQYATKIAENARSARDVIKICENLCDICEIENNQMNQEIVERAIKYSGYEIYGLTKNEIKYLEYLKAVGSASLLNMTSYLNISKQEIQEKIETFLIRKSYIQKDTNGRSLTGQGYKLLEKMERSSNANRTACQTESSEISALHQ